MLNISHQAPAFTQQDVLRFAREHYGIQANLRALPGEHDQNFSLQTSTGESFVLKIAHAGEALNVLDLQSKALEHLATHAPSLVVPLVQKTLHGEAIAVVKSSGGTTYFMRLLSYVPGK